MGLGAAGVPLFLQIAGMALGAYGAYQSYQSSRQAATAAAQQAFFNAQAAQDAANEALSAGLEEAGRHRARVKAMLGEQQARYAASGVLLEGTPADVLAAQAEIGEQEARDIVEAAQSKWEQGMKAARAIAMGGSYTSKYYRQAGVATIITGGSQLAWTASQGTWKWPSTAKTKTPSGAGDPE